MNGRDRRPRSARRLLRTRRGVLEMPLELLIIVLVLSIVLPIVLGGFLAFRAFQAQDQMEVAVNDIVATAAQAFEGDLNTTLLLAVNPGGASITIGAPLLSPLGLVDANAVYALGTVGTFQYREIASTGATQVPMTNLTTGHGPMAFVLVSSMTLYFEKRAYPLPGGGVADYVLVGKGLGT